MARLIDLPPGYVSGGRYLAAAPSIEERSYKVESAMGDVKRILEFAETIGKSQLTGLAIKGIAKLYEMGQPSMADLQAQEAKLREALAAEGKTEGEIDLEIAALIKTAAALKKAYTEIPVPEAPDAPPAPPPAVAPLVGSEALAPRPDVYGGGYVTEPRERTVPPSEGTPEPHPYWDTTPVPGTTETVGQKRQREDQEAYQAAVAAQEAEQERIAIEEAEIGQEEYQLEQRRHATSRRIAEQQERLARVREEIAEVPTFRGQEMRTMDDIVAVASTASKEERGALLVAARNLATPSNLFDFDYKQDAMKKVTELFPTALDLRRESLTATELRKTMATEKRAAAAMMKAVRANDLDGLKAAKLQTMITKLQQDIDREPLRKEKLEAQIRAFATRAASSKALMVARREALKFKKEELTERRIRTLKQPIERLYRSEIEGLTNAMNAVNTAAQRASAKMTLPKDSTLASMGAELESRYTADAEIATVAHKAAIDRWTALGVTRMKLKKQAIELTAIRDIDAFNAFIDEHGAR